MRDIKASRTEKLLSIGLEFDGVQFTYPYRCINVHWMETVVMSDQEFSKLVENIEFLIEESKKNGV